nr:Mariner Mos1 transposase [Hymenolepis microstoma]
MKKSANWLRLTGFKAVSGDFAVEDRHKGGGWEKVFEDAELETIFLWEDSCQTEEELSESSDVALHLTRLAQWHMVWLTGTSARMKKWRKIGSTH